MKTILITLALLTVTLAGCATNDRVPQCDESAPSHYEVKTHSTGETREVVEEFSEGGWTNVVVDTKRRYTEVEGDCPESSGWVA